jgi:outer membrane protein assembly factor BamB
MKATVAPLILTGMLFAHAALGAEKSKPAPLPLAIEDLGQPVVRRSLGMRCVTRDASGVLQAWAAYETADRFALVGVGLDDGKTTWVEINQFGPPPTRSRHPQMMSAADGNLYAFVGVPGRFIKYDVTTHTLTDLGVPSPKASYWSGSDVAADGRFYVGTYPETELVRCDPASGKVENLGRLTTDDRLKYAPHPVVSDEGTVYCPVGMQHGELWAFDPRTGGRKQILPEAMLRAQGAPEVWRGRDGRVYGQWAGAKFRCTPESIVMDETSPAVFRAHPRYVGDLVVSDLENDGRLKLTRHGKVSYVQTDYPGAPRTIFSVSCEREGRIYGGTVSPADPFSYDPVSRKFTDFGQITGGPIQIYDTLSHPRGLFISSYMNASVDFLDPGAAMAKDVNPRHVVTLDGHERPMQEILGPDGMIYTGTVPAKGRLGGALLRVNPADFSHQTWTNILPNQSITRLAAVPKTGEVLGVTSIYGGSSAAPTETEACLLLWDCQRAQLVFTAQPLPGAKAYGAVVRAANGLVYGVGGGNKFFVFDPVARQTIFTGALPIKTLHFPDLADEPFGPRGLIYGLGDDAIFALDPADHQARIVARDAKLKSAYGFCIAHDGMLYFGSGSHLMRCPLPAQN